MRGYLAAMDTRPKPRTITHPKGEFQTLQSMAEHLRFILTVLKVINLYNDQDKAQIAQILFGSLHFKPLTFTAP